MTSLPKSSYRNIKRIQTPTNDETKNTLTYTFFQKIISDNILLLKDEKEKLNYSTWLMRLNNEEKNSRILHLIKILLVSIKNNHVYFIFTKPPPEDLSELNLKDDHTVEMIEYLRVNTLEQNKHMFVHMSKSKRSAAVNSDMMSYSLSKTSHYIVQSFYAISDHPIYTWYNPAAIEVPNNIDHNQWELYLTRFNLLSQNKNKNRNLQGNTCEDIMKLDQVSKEVVSKFNWHPHSVLFTSSRPKISAAFYDTDSKVLAQPVIQQQIDEAAFAIVHNKSFPGFKALNQKALYDELMPGPEHVFKMTGVRITYNSISPSTFKSCTRRWVMVEDSNAVCWQDAAAGRDKKGDGNTAKKQSCRAVQPAENAGPTCKRVTTLNVTEFRKSPIESGPSRRSKYEPNTTDSNDNSCKNRKKCSDPPNRDQSVNDNTDHDWIKFSDEMSVDQEWKPNFNSTCRNPHKNSDNNRSQACPKDDRLAGLSTGQNRRKAETCAVDRSISRCSQGRVAVNSSSNAVGCGSRKVTRTTVSPIRELTETDTTDPNDNSCKTKNKCSDPPNREQSVNDNTDYDWTKFSDEISVDRQWKPDFNSTRKNPHERSHNNRSQACRKDDRLAGLSTGQNQRKAETCAVDRSSSRCSQGRVAVNSSSNAVGCRSRKVTRTAVSPIRELTETDTTDTNDNSCKTREKCSDPPNREQSVNDNTDYDWTKFSDEISADRECKPNLNSSRKNPHNSSDNNRSLACRKDDRLVDSSTGQNQRKADTSAVDRSTSRRSQDRVAVNLSLNAVGYRSRKEPCTTVSPIPESTETDEHPRERGTWSDNCSHKSQWSNELDFVQSQKFGSDGRLVNEHHVIKNDADNFYIKDVSMPHISFDSHAEFHDTKSFPVCESRDNIEDVSMPRMDYDTSFSSDG